MTASSAATATTAWIGGTGNDSLAGSQDDDTYVVNVATDVITEDAGEGSDLVQVAFAAAGTYVLSANLEKATVTGTVAGINLTGNTGDNLLTGSASTNTLSGGDGNDTLAGLGGNDTLNGNAGDDRLDGGTGIDRLAGGTGDDTYVVNTTAVTDPTTGVVTYTVNTVVEDTSAGSGSDTVEVAYTVAGTHTLAANVENGVITGNVAGLNLTGNLLDNTLTGNALANKLAGAAGNDTLNGWTATTPSTAAPATTAWSAALGNDTYVVNNAADVISENLGEGTDLVQVAFTAAGTYVLSDNLENATVTGTVAGINLTGNGGANLLTGSALANTLDGAGGNDTLNGGAGNDSLVGGGGNDSLIGGTGNDSLAGGQDDDTYVVNVATDVISEDAGEGSDLVQVAFAAAGTYVLSANLEKATVTGTVAGINLTGNTGDNLLTGSASTNTLSGGDGNDTLAGLGGNDTLNGNAGDDRLDGGTGIDRLAGGTGDDTYVVNTTAVTDPTTGVVTYTVDTVVEDTIAGSGSDTVEVAYTVAGTHTLAANVENGVITGNVAGLNLTGNLLDNTLNGNALANKLAGAAGNDTLNGLDGNDTLDGGTGNDSLVGGTGNDTYVVNNDADVISENLGEGTDLVQVAFTAAGTYVLSDNLENATVTGTVAGINLTGNGGPTC